MVNQILKNFLKGLIAAFVIALVISINTATNATISLSYKMTNLGTLGGKSSIAYDLNDARQVVGESETYSGFSHAFLWQNLKMTDLGTLDGYENSCALSINQMGQIVGYSYNKNNTEQRAFLWEKNKMTDLGTLAGKTTKAVAINNQGQIIGNYSDDKGFSTRSLLWQNGEITDLGIPESDDVFTYRQFVASDINDAGQIVGEAFGLAQGYLLENGKFTNLGYLSRRFHYPLKINKKGCILLYKNSGSYTVHAVVLNNRTRTELIPFDNIIASLGESLTIGYDINNSNKVVGISSIRGPSTPPGRITTAFLWSYTKNMTALIPEILPHYPLSFETPTAINNRGYIVGNGKSYKSKRAILLTPVSTSS